MKVVIARGKCEDIQFWEKLLLMSVTKIDAIRKFELPATQLQKGQDEFNSPVHVSAYRVTFDEKWWPLCRYISLRFYYDERKNWAMVKTDEIGRDILKRTMPGLIVGKGEDVGEGDE